MVNIIPELLGHGPFNSGFVLIGWKGKDMAIKNASAVVIGYQCGFMGGRGVGLLPFNFKCKRFRVFAGRVSEYIGLIYGVITDD